MIHAAMFLLGFAVLGCSMWREEMRIIEEEMRPFSRANWIYPPAKPLAVNPGKYSLHIKKASLKHVIF